MVALQMAKIALVYIIFLLCYVSVLGSSSTPGSKPDRFAPYPKVRPIAPAGNPNFVMDAATTAEMKPDSINPEERTAFLLARIGNLHKEFKKIPKSQAAERVRLIQEMGKIQKELLTYDVCYIYSV